MVSSDHSRKILVKYYQNQRSNMKYRYIEVGKLKKIVVEVLIK